MFFSQFLYPFHGTTVFQKLFCSRYAFAARGWKIEPWDDAAQTLSSACESNSKRQCHLWKLCADFLSPRMDKDKDEPLTGARDASFKHYCSCYPGGKPTYNLKLSKEAGTAGRFKDWFWMPSRPSTFSELC